MSGIKQEAEIQEKEKTPQQQALDAMVSQLEKPIEAPPIEETLGKVAAALAQAQKAKHKPLKQTWYCTDCGSPHIQNDGMSLGLEHIRVDAIDDEFVNSNGTPLTGKELTLMEKYAVPKVQEGNSHHQSSNATTLAKMQELKTQGGK